MTTDPKECSEHAKRCVALAAQAIDPVVQRRLLETAQGWMRLAFDLAKMASNRQSQRTSWWLEFSSRAASAKLDGSPTKGKASPAFSPH